MSQEKAPVSQAAPQLDALNGMRFFAVFHIFLYHIWSTHFELPRAQGNFANVYANLDDFPRWLNNLIAHGYLSTSFFFLLSGFILAFLYWKPDGTLSTTRGRFWWQRFTRIYPVHLIALVITVLLFLPRYWMDPDAPSIALSVASGLATATLTQAWFAPLVPVWSWPTWALSAVVFLYAIMPWLMGRLARLTRGQALGLLVAMPAISLLPTLVFLCVFPDGGKGSQNWQIFLGSLPLFWVPHFVAGMLMTRVFHINRFETGWQAKSRPWISPGDVALIGVVALSLMDPNIEGPHHLVWRHILRHGALMPLYMLILYDLALGRGFVARLFSLPGMGFLGQTSFSIFIWQNIFLALGFGIAMSNPASKQLSFWFAVIGLTVMALISTYWIEKPIARRMRRNGVPFYGLMNPKSSASSSEPWRNTRSE
jgi:peptidoglycan/LPS O-acetylase OafA/YrhL